MITFNNHMGPEGTSRVARLEIPVPYDVAVRRLTVVGGRPIVGGKGEAYTDVEWRGIYKGAMFTLYTYKNDGAVWSIGGDVRSGLDVEGLKRELLHILTTGQQLNESANIEVKNIGNGLYQLIVNGRVVMDQESFTVVDNVRDAIANPGRWVGTEAGEIADGLRESKQPTPFMTFRKALREGRIEAYGVKGMMSKQWRKTFKSEEEMERWTLENDASVLGYSNPDSPTGSFSDCSDGTCPIGAPQSVTESVADDYFRRLIQNLTDLNDGNKSDAQFKSDNRAIWDAVRTDGVTAVVQAKIRDWQRAGAELPIDEQRHRAITEALHVFPNYDDAYRQAQEDANKFNRPMGIEKADEYGRQVFRVQMIPKDPNQRFGWETRVQVVEPTMSEAKKSFTQLRKQLHESAWDTDDPDYDETLATDLADMDDGPCPMCGSREFTPLGRLGNVRHMRCRRCGAQVNTGPTDEPLTVESFKGWKMGSKVRFDDETWEVIDIKGSEVTIQNTKTDEVITVDEGELVMSEHLKACDFCLLESAQQPKRAVVDGLTKRGPQAHMCAEHFKQFGAGLGKGRGRVLAEETRSLSAIAAEIRRDWKNVYFGAKPYLDAMSELNSINDNYYADSGQSVVVYFLANATTWRGETAKRIKAELKAMAGLR